MFRCVRYVEALDMNEIRTIIALDKTKQLYDVVCVDIVKEFPEKFFWKNDSKAMEGFKKALYSGPFNYVVLFFESIY